MASWAKNIDTDAPGIADMTDDERDCLMALMALAAIFGVGDYTDKASEAGMDMPSVDTIQSLFGDLGPIDKPETVGV